MSLADVSLPWERNRIPAHLSMLSSKAITSLQASQKLPNLESKEARTWTPQAQKT
jgi:hypothetical protein